MKRTFGADGDLIHDPASGLTHRAPEPKPRGRIIMDDQAATAWPVVAPSTLDRDTPVSICWSPIVRCNLHCPQCLDDTTVTELPWAQRRETAAVLATTNVLGVDISGGEPLLLADLTDLLRLIREGGSCAVSVTTNGWHLARRTSELVGHVDAVRVSLDGPDSARHDDIRGADSFRRAVAGIRAAVSRAIPVQIQTVLMRRTAPYIQDIVDLAAETGAGGFTLLQMLPIGAGSDLRHELVTDQDATQLVDGLRVPDGVRVRLRTRELAGNFTIVRADGRVWRNHPSALAIGGLHALRHAHDLTVSGKDGSA